MARFPWWRLAILFVLLISAAGVVYTQDTCPGAPAPRLIVGENGVVMPGSTNNVRNSPSTSGELAFQMSAGTLFEVLDGPACADGYAWWQVSTAGGTGWTVEGSEDEYFLQPVAADAAPTPTSASAGQPEGECGLPTRLFEGQFAFLNSTTPNRLRDQPSASGAQITQVFNDQNFTLLEGPVCAEGFTWWRIEYKDEIGWTVESNGDDYFMDGVAATATPPPSSTPSPTLAPTPTATPAYIGFTEPREVVWTSDGGRIVVSTNRDGLFVFDGENLAAPPEHLLAGLRIVALEAHPTEPELVALITGNPENDGDGYRVVLYDVAADEEVALIASSAAGYSRGLQVAADSALLIRIENGNLAVDDLAGENDFSLPMPSLMNQETFNHAAISADGQTYAASAGLLTDDGIATVVFVGEYGEDPIAIEQEPVIETRSRSLAMNADGSLVVLGDNVGSLRVWSLPDYTYSSFIRSERSGTSNTINAMIFDPQNRLITAESDPQAVVRVFVMPELTVVNTYNPRGFTTAQDVSLNPASDQIAVVLDDVVHIVDLASMERVTTLAPIRN
ncbi:MAG: SH3 domain-containing protein [Pleurocapsa minor GSE-CHR-MK-17-07R]|jgi:WD40 repeat protein|nr:SH3 domain-containing protein [Pleurocapsa minor GSE-CHR-MK 17-07R]